MAPRLTFHLILHTHWDREWYLPQAGFQPRLVAAMGDVLDLLERDSSARFVLDGQTVLAEDVLDVHPDWIALTAALVAEGRLEIGPWYVLGDELVPSGESMIRNLLQGARDSAALSRRMNVLYSPDAFGHPAILPTLAREFGIDAAVVWRGLGRPTGLDRDLYRWRGPDGAEVLTYHLPAQGYEIGADLDGPEATLPERWRAIRGELVDRAVTSQIAVFAGADHHAPPEDPGGICAKLRELEPDHHVRMSSLEEFFGAARIEAGAAPMLNGELRWSYGHTWTLQGSHATRARLKRRHTGVELHMQRMAEPLAAIAGWIGGHDRRGLLRGATRALLKCQFHDTLCGCCSDDAAREQETRLTSIAASNRETVRASLHELVGHDPDRARRNPSAVTPTLLLWNPVARQRGGIVTAEVTCFRRDVLVGPPTGRMPRIGAGFQPLELVTAAGEQIPVQVLSIIAGTERLDAARHYPDQDEVDRVRIAFDVPQVAGLGVLSLLPRPGTGSPAGAGLDVRERHMSNRFVEVQVATDGEVNLTDRRTGERFHDLLQCVDESDLGDSYTPHIIPGSACSGFAGGVHHCVLAEGPLLGALEIRFAMAEGARGRVSGRLVLLLHADSPVLRARIELDNRATEHRLRVRVPVGAGDAAVAGAAFARVRREAMTAREDRFAAEQPVATAPAHRHVAAAASGRGLAVLCPGFFEYEWTSDRDFFITVLRAVGELSRGALPTRPGHAGWPMHIPDANEPGPHVIELAMVPLNESELDDPATLECHWEDVFAGIQPTFVRDFVGDVSSSSAFGVELQGRGLVFSSLKQTEAGEGLVLRCYNMSTVSTRGRWVFRSAIARAERVRADETPLGGIDLMNPREIEFNAEANAIVAIVAYPRR